jgi:ABC-type bacteriocin/lantibiotic exporter with double-glycine peptidase domain
VSQILFTFQYMWQFALLAVACVPLMGAAAAVRVKTFVGEDEGDLNAADSLNTPGGVIVETLLNMRTVTALCLESQRYQDYERSLLVAEPHFKSDSFVSGFASGFSTFVQQWIYVSSTVQYYSITVLLDLLNSSQHFRDFKCGLADTCYYITQISTGKFCQLHTHHINKRC